MAGWPSIERAEDQWLAESLGSDRAAPAHLYDLYAARLFDYCHVLLRDEQAASGALLDSLLAMRERGGDARSFRGRLYALTREESLRRRSEATAGRRRAAEAAGAGADEASRRLVHAALLVLSGRQREALDLSLRHGLSAGDLATVLRITPDDAAALLVRARRDLDDAFAAVLVTTAGRDDCPSVSSLAGPPGRPLDARTSGVLARHIAACPICGTRGDLEVPTPRLLDAMPVAALPGDLRERFLAATADPWFADARSPVAARAEAPARRHSRERQRNGSRLWPVAAGVAFATLMAGGTFYVLSDTGSQAAGNDQAMPGNPGDQVPGGPSASDSGAPLSGRDAGSPSASPSTSSGTPTPTPTPGQSTPEATPVSQPTTPQSPTQATTPPPPPPPAPGTLVAYGCSMGHGYSCTITVTASGGPVNWSVTATNGVRAGGGGYLPAGQSAGVTASRSGGWCWGHHSGSVSFSGGATASVDWYC